VVYRVTFKSVGLQENVYSVRNLFIVRLPKLQTECVIKIAKALFWYEPVARNKAYILCRGPVPQWCGAAEAPVPQWCKCSVHNGAEVPMSQWCGGPSVSMVRRPQCLNVVGSTGLHVLCFWSCTISTSIRLRPWVEEAPFTLSSRKGWRICDGSMSGTEVLSRGRFCRDVVITLLFLHWLILVLSILLYPR